MSDEIEVISNYEDLSTDLGFQFEFKCARCDAGFRTPFKASAVGAASEALEAASNVLGGIFGAAADVAAAGVSFGVFTAAGAALGGLTGLLTVKPLSSLRIRVGPMSGPAMGQRLLTVGPVRDLKLLTVLVDRAVLYAAWAASRAHAERSSAGDGFDGGVESPTRSWTREQRRIFADYLEQSQRTIGLGRDPDELEAGCLETVLDSLRRALDERT